MGTSHDDDDDDAKPKPEATSGRTGGVDGRQSEPRGGVEARRD
jgi:hypothetical protein